VYVEEKLDVSFCNISTCTLCLEGGWVGRGRGRGEGEGREGGEGQGRREEGRVGGGEGIH
jgi:hypothetical protein